MTYYKVYKNDEEVPEGIYFDDDQFFLGFDENIRHVLVSVLDDEEFYVDDDFINEYCEEY